MDNTRTYTIVFFSNFTDVQTRINIPVRGSYIPIVAMNCESPNLEVPYCGDSSNFPNNHWQILVPGFVNYYVWQNRALNRDLIRYSTNGAFGNQAPALPGLEEEPDQNKIAIIIDSIGGIRAQEVHF